MFSGPVKKMNSFFQIELTLISRTFERVLVRSSSMTDSSIWLLEIWPKWILVIKKQKCQLGPILYAADDSKAPCVGLCIYNICSTTSGNIISFPYQTQNTLSFHTPG